MAQKRMFTKKVIDNDNFLDMPTSAQCLYFHLNMWADDDGFIDNPKRIMRSIGAREDDLRILLARSYVLPFESGVLVIRHWRLHNCISQNRYHETQYAEEKSRLRLTKNKTYSLTDGVPIDDSGMIEAQSSAPLPLEDLEEDVEEKPKRNDYPKDFEAFWADYPRKADKGMAYRKYQARLKDGFSPEEMWQAARNYKMECDRNHTDMKYIKHPKTFLGDATPFVDYIRRSEPAVAEDSGGAADFDKYL